LTSSLPCQTRTKSVDPDTSYFGPGLAELLDGMRRLPRLYPRPGAVEGRSAMYAPGPVVTEEQSITTMFYVHQLMRQQSHCDSRHSQIHCRTHQDWCCPPYQKSRPCRFGCPLRRRGCLGARRERRQDTAGQGLLSSPVASAHQRAHHAITENKQM
jgi:hypothetical protein